MAGEILTSTGSIGVTRGTYNRVRSLDANVVAYESLVTNYSRMREMLGRRATLDGGRILAKMPVSIDTLGRLQVENPHMIVDLEVVAPFVGGKNDEVFIYLAKNHESREVPVPISEVVENTKKYYTDPSMPLDRLSSLADSGHRFVSDLEDPDIRKQVFSLWSQTFGWTEKQLEVLQERLRVTKIMPPEDRLLWATFLVNSYGIVVSAAMAEGVQLDGKVLIESTEWRTKDEYQGRGYGTAAVMATNVQVLADMEKRKELYLLHTEGNNRTRADRLGYGAGYRVPNRNIVDSQGFNVLEGHEVPQVVAANVEVDGHMSTFAFMCLTEESIRTYYPSEHIALMQKMIV
jgi:hypothetical protein